MDWYFLNNLINFFIIKQILNTINTELNNLNINQNLSENTIVNQNSDFINQIYNSVKNNSQEENKNYVNNDNKPEEITKLKNI
jgi:hypothetical protein